jgi:predicted TIM-barrel fold metal-dependent hydrolase
MEKIITPHTMPATPTCPPPDPNPKKPAYVPLQGSINSHCHIFGPASIFPYARKRTYTPPDAPVEAFQKLQDHLGLHRAVIVQGACHGYNHDALLNALQFGKGKYRGVALVDPEMKKEAVARLDKAGTCGARLNFLAHTGGRPSMERIEKTLSLIRPFGWHLAMHVSGSGLVDVADFIRSLDLSVVIDHMARVDIREGIQGTAFQTLLRLLDTGKVWVKLSGTDRISVTPPPFSDAVALARLVAERAPERILWGNDWPHPNIKNVMPNDGELVDLIPEIATSEATRQKMLVSNPEEFFGFKPLSNRA